MTSVQFNPINEGEFISGSIDGKVRLWQISDRRVFDWVDARHMVTSVCYRPDSKANNCNYIMIINSLSFVHILIFPLILLIQGFTVGCSNGTCRFYDIEGMCTIMFLVFLFFEVLFVSFLMM